LSVKINRKKSSSNNELLACGKLAGCFGIKGFLKLQSYAQSPERFKKLRQLYIGQSVEQTELYIVEEVRFTDRSILIKFAEVDNRTLAEKLVGKLVFVAKRNSVKLRKGSYFIHDIIGCTVWSSEGCQLGTIDDIYKMPAQDIWVIRNGEKLNMIPAVKNFIQKVDMENRKVIVKIIDGLLD
jgi:16S rRNA processing protein RimM